jgi:peroxiredoxin
MIVNQPLVRALRMLLGALVLAAGLGSAAAQTAAVGAAPSLQGKTTDGKNFQLSQLQGKVVMVMFWSTDCAVCRDKMRELRANYAGWAGKPFELVLVSTDRSMKDIEAYDQIISQSVPLKQRFVSLWSGGSGFKQGFGAIAQLPSTFVLDQKGKVVDSYLGRIPTEAWDKVAELL